MGDWISRFVLLAAGDAAPKAPAPAAGDGGGMGPFFTFFPLIVVGVLFYFILILPQRREKQKQDQLLKALKKNDRVVTIGGIVGTIVNIEPDSRLVTVRVDDERNTRLVFLRSAIQGPYAGDGQEQPTVKETTS
jgi:preprotein translocase subunit YajC